MNRRRFIAQAASAAAVLAAVPQKVGALPRPYKNPGLRTTRERLKSLKALNRSTEVKRRGRRVEALVNDIQEVPLLSD